MNKLTGEERIRRVLQLEEPDVVPHFELGVAKNVINAIVPGASYRVFVEKMDHDGIVVFDKIGAWSYEEVDPGKKIFRDHWGSLIQYTSEALAHPVEPAIKTEADLDSYVPPDPDEEWRYKYLKGSLERFGGERAVFAHVTDVFDVAKDFLLGDEPYYAAMVENPELVDRVN